MSTPSEPVDYIFVRPNRVEFPRTAFGTGPGQLHVPVHAASVQQVDGHTEVTLTFRVNQAMVHQEPWDPADDCPF